MLSFGFRSSLLLECILLNPEPLYIDTHRQRRVCVLSLSEWMMGKVAKTTDGKGGEVVPVNFVRTENVLRKYPMHILQKGQEGVNPDFSPGVESRGSKTARMQ